MTSIRNVFLTVRWLPSVQPVRFSRRINIQRPRAPHYERAKVIDVCKPFFFRKTDTRPMYELCEKSSLISGKSDSVPEENPYFQFLTREFMNFMNSSRMIAFFHLNSSTAEEKFKVRVLLKKQNMYVKVFNRNIVRHAVENTKYEAILPLFESHTAIVFSPDTPVKKLLQVSRKTPHMVLLAGIVDGQQLSKSELVRYSTLPDLPAAQAGLVGVLNMLGSHLVSSLNAHQQTLVRHLDQHIELQKNTPTEDTPTSTVSSAKE